MKKRPMAAIITATEAAAVQLIDDTVLRQYWFAASGTAGNAELNKMILGPIPYGKTKRCIYVTPKIEKPNVVILGGTNTEVIAASTRYSIQVWNSNSDYETQKQNALVYAYTTPAVLSGTPATDRLNVYTALANKINAYSGNNVKAHLLAKVPFTLGTSTGDAAANFIPGEVVTQATSGITAQVAACVITGGTFAADTAAGDLYLYNISDVTLYDAGTKTWTAAGTVAATDVVLGTTNCVVTGTAAAAVFATGLAIVDDPGYLTSGPQRGGINRVGVVSGFSVATPTVLVPGEYNIGVGSDMLAQRPTYDLTKQDCVSGNMEYDFTLGRLPVAGTFYKKYVLEVEDGDEQAIDATKVSSVTQLVLYFATTTSGHVTSMDAAIAAVILK